MVCSAAGRCVPCSSDGQCELRELCDPGTRRCAFRPGWGADCVLNEQCPAGQLCVQGLCRPEREATVCVGGACLATGQRCNRTNGVCEEDIGCLTDSDCDPAQLCNLPTNTCVPRCTDETKDEICEAGQKCIDNRCTDCADNSDCPGDLICDRDKLQCVADGSARCLSDRDCEVGFVCNEATGFCTPPPPPCLSNEDCLSEERCDTSAGKCRPRACQPDRYEPNDAQENARPLAVGTHDSLTLCEREQDWYSFNLLRGDHIDLFVQADPLIEPFLNTRLLDSAGATLVQDSLVLDYTAPLDGVYFLRMQSADAFVEYELRVSISSPYGGYNAGSSDAGFGGPDGGAPLPDDAGVVHLVAVRSASPSRGSAAGGLDVTIKGSSFFQGFAESATDAQLQTRVWFGGNEAGDLRVINDETLEVAAPPHAPGDVDVVVQNPNGTATCSACFTYFVKLALDSLAPASGPLEGGTELTLAGLAFTPDLVVLVGGKESPRVDFLDSRTVRAIAPPSSRSGPVDVRVFNGNGVGDLRESFTYRPALRIEAVEPPFGPLAGLALAQIRGQSLASVSQVLIGSNPATLASINDDTIELSIPGASVPGPVDVVVETATGSTTLNGGFIYDDEGATGPALTGIWPAHGPASGGNLVTLVGDGFEVTSTVTFDLVQARMVELLTPSALVVEAPPGAANTFAEICVAGVCREQSYLYHLALSSLSPSSGSIQGGERVTLTGAGFTPGLEVLFGALPATGITIVDANTLTLLTPPGGAGITEVLVREAALPENQDALQAAWSYLSPLTLSYMSPPQGAVAGGTYVTVLGRGFQPSSKVKIGPVLLKDRQIVDGNTLTGHTPPGEEGSVGVTLVDGAQSDSLSGGFTYFDPKNGGGSSGGPLEGSLNVTVLQNSYGTPLAGATVMLGTDPTTPWQARTNLKGQVTLSGPKVAGPQQVTISRSGYLTLTVAGQRSENLTVFLGSTVGGGGGGTSGTGLPTPPALISGHVTGFKLPRPLELNEEAVAEVWLMPRSVSPSGTGQASPETRDRRGERWRVTADGGNFTIFSGKGMQALYAVFGIIRRPSNQFTPLLLGIRKDVNADPNRPAFNQDIALTMHLDQQVNLTVENVLPAQNQVYAWLTMGGEGVVPVGSATGEGDLLLSHLPRVDGDSLIFINQAVPTGSGPSGRSYFWRRQRGPLSQGLTIGPMLGLVHVTRPAVDLGSNARLDGTIAWSMGDGTIPDILQLSLTLVSELGFLPLWTAILPGSETSIVLPGDLLEQIRSSAQPGDQLQLSLEAARSPRFDYAYWSYSQLSASSWISWSSMDTSFGPPDPTP
jgi:hypothetical protein